MSAFYGTIQGNRGMATRGGSKLSGYKASCQSYDGSVIVSMRYDRDDKLEVRIATSEDSSCWGNNVFRGTLEELNKIFEDYRKKKALEGAS